VEIGEAVVAHDRGERAVDAPAPGEGELLAGSRLQQAGEDAFGRAAYFHDPPPPPARKATRRASCCGGSTAEASPASATARGIPQIDALSRSCTSIAPPVSTSARLPSAPSRPMPLITMPSPPAP